MRIPSGKTDQKIAFVAYDSADATGLTVKTGLSSFTVYRSRNGGTATLYTTPTVAELDATNMPGVYVLTVDEDTTIASTSDSEEMILRITATGMYAVTRDIELYRRDTTSGQTLTVANGAGDADLERIQGTVVSTPATAGILDVNLKNIANATVSASAAQLGVNVVNFGGSAGTFASGRPEVNTTHAAGTAWGSGAITAASIASAAITSAKFATDAIDANAIAAAAIGSSELAASAATEISAAVWAEATRTLTANTNLNDLSAAGVRAAVGLASANLDTQLTTIDDFLDTEIAAIKAKTDLIPGTIDGKTFAEIVTLVSAVLLGKLSGAGTGTEVFRDMADAKDRVTATVDASGNRTAITLDAS